MSRLKKFLILLPVLVADGWIARSLALKRAAGESHDAMLEQFCVCGIVFGTLCILFADRMGSAHGHIGHGYADPTPGPVVEAFGWLLAVLPAVIWVVAD